MEELLELFENNVKPFQVGFVRARFVQQLHTRLQLATRETRPTSILRRPLTSLRGILTSLRPDRLKKTDIG
jgi:hypothetical protein